VDSLKSLSNGWHFLHVGQGTGYSEWVSLWGLSVPVGKCWISHILPPTPPSRSFTFPQRHGRIIRTFILTYKASQVSGWRSCFLFGFQKNAGRHCIFPGSSRIRRFVPLFFLPCRGPSLYLSVCQYETAGEPLNGFSLSSMSVGFLKIYRRSPKLVNEQRLIETLH
jgi:hypothetical protein